jgi:hypothetical protein
MLVEAAKAGLEIEEAKARVVLGKCAPSPAVEGLPQFAKTDANAYLHQSLHGVWWLLEFLPQQDPHLHGDGWHLPMGRTRTIPPGSHIHQSVIEGKWKPSNLPEHTVEPWVRM